MYLLCYKRLLKPMLKPICFDSLAYLLSKKVCYYKNFYSFAVIYLLQYYSISFVSKYFDHLLIHMWNLSLLVWFFELRTHFFYASCVDLASGSVLTFFIIFFYNKHVHVYQVYYIISIYEGITKMWLKKVV